MQNRTLRTDFSGDRVFKPGLKGVELWKPDFTAYDNVVRPYPVPNHDGGFFSCFDSDGNPNGWYCELPMVVAMGRRYLTCVIDNNRRTVDELRAQSPIYLLYNAIAKVKNLIERDHSRVPGDRAGWPRLLTRVTGKGGGQSISLPDYIGLFQGAVFRGGKGPFVKDETPGPGARDRERHAMTVNDGQGDPPRGGLQDDPSVVFQLPESARKAFAREMFKGPGVDVVDIRAGRFVHIFNQKFDPRDMFGDSAQTVTPQRVGFGAANPNAGRVQKQAASSDFSGYNVYLSNELDSHQPDSVRADVIADYGDLVASKWRDWNDIIWFPSDEELAHLVARMCGPADEDYRGQIMPVPLSALDYAWGDFPSWIPDDVRRLGVRREQAQVPAGAPAGQAPAAPAAPAGPAAPGGQAAPPRATGFGARRPAHTAPPAPTQTPTPAAPPASDLERQAGEVFGGGTAPAKPAASTILVPPPAGAAPLPPSGQGAQQANEELRRRMAASEARVRLEQEAARQNATHTQQTTDQSVNANG
jgi:hypothetical protein